MKVENNIPAFPRTFDQEIDRVNNCNISQNGMSLLDYFAAKAMQSYCLGSNDTKANAHFAYEAAAAMLEERKNFLTV